MGRAMLHLAIVFAEMELDLARERTLAGLERVKATGKHLGRRNEASRKRADEIQSMRQRNGLSLGRIATITGLPSSSIRRICTGDLEEIAPTAFGEGQPAYHGPEALPWWMSLAAESNPGNNSVHAPGPRSQPRAG